MGESWRAAPERGNFLRFEDKRCSPCQKKLPAFHFPGFRRCRGNSISAPSFFLSDPNPLRWALCRFFGRNEPLSLLLRKSQLSLRRGAKETAVDLGSPPWGRAGAQRLRGGILRVSRTSNLLPMFLLKQWPPLRMQACCFPQKHGISTASASLRSHYGFLLLRAQCQIYTSLT